MKHLYAVKDIATDTFGMPFAQHNKGEALRTMGNVANNPNSEGEIAKHPGDFVLYEIGTYDEENGTITAYQKPTQLCRVSDLIASKE